MDGTNVSRTFEQLKKLFDQRVIFGPHNELVMRDLIESIFQHGGISLPAGQFVAGDEQTVGEDFVCLDQFTSADTSTSDVVPLDNGIKFLRPGVYWTSIGLSFTGSNNTVFEGNLMRKRGIEPDEPLDICTFVETIRPNSEISNGGGGHSLEVEADDIIEYNIKADSPGSEFKLMAGHFNVFRIG